MLNLSACQSFNNMLQQSAVYLDRMSVAAFKEMRAYGYVSQLGIPLPASQGLGVLLSNSEISRASVCNPDGSMSH